MRTEEFLQAVLGDEGYYCVVGIKAKEDKRVQKFYPDLDAAVHAAYSLDQSGFDAYYGLATFETGDNRKNENVKQLRSFFLDLDCGLSKSYRSQAEALTGLRIFCKDLNLPRPMLVNSGNGIHVYWVLTEAVSRDEWLPVAEKLKNKCREYGLHADPVVTADSARILRVVGTRNHKSDPPKAVELIGSPSTPIPLKAFSEVLGTDVFAAPKKYVPAERDSVMEALSGSYTSVFRDIMNKSKAGVGCAQLWHAANNQNDIDEPLWRATLSIAKFCEDGEEMVHKVSRKHKDYSEQQTNYKVSLIKGPYTCQKFDEYRPDVCQKCPNWGKFRSPIALGKKVRESEENVVVTQPLLDVPAAPPQQFVIPKYPAPYFRGSGGGVFKRVRVGKSGEEEEKEVPVYHNDLYVVRRVRDPEMGECAVIRLHLPRDGVREFTVPLTAVGSKDEFRKHLAAHGVAVIKMDELMAYTSQWINDLQLKTVAEEARRQFGWTNDDPNTGMESFVVGNMEIFKDRIEVNSPSSKTLDLFPAFTPKGTLEMWKENMEFWNRPGMEMHQYMVGLSFGAPLVPFLENMHGAIFHVHSKDSGLGKTTAMFAGASVWGDPDQLVLQERDTYASKMNRAEIYKNLPFYMDEMTNTLPKDLSDFAYQIPSGQQRNRLGSKGNTERKRGAPWKTLVGSTGNTSMLERISSYKAMPKAEAQRILESRAKVVDTGAKANTDEFSRNIMRCYGHAGVVYIQYLLNHKKEAWDILLGTQERLDKMARLSKENRYWSMLAAAPITGLMLARRAGLINWQIKPIVEYVVAVMDNARDTVTGMGGDVQSILTDYWAENYNNILRIKSTDNRNGGASTGLDHLIQPEASPRAHLVARYEYDVKKIYLLPKPLKEWCAKQQINYSGFLDGLKSGPTQAKLLVKRLGAGTNINLPPTGVWEIDCSTFLTDETEETIAAGALLFEKQNQAD
jgi:hypothetical protein